MERFSTDDLITCYRRGVFPMADARHDARVFLVDPARRGVLPLERFHVSRRLARTVRSDRFEIRVDTAFASVVEGCAAPRAGRLETWINAPIQRLCDELFARGLAHSVEAWRDGRLVGGIETTIPLFQDLLADPEILEGRYHIHWLEEWLKRGS